jgi:outer membrane protein assembly factor BamB
VTRILNRACTLLLIAGVSLSFASCSDAPKSSPPKADPAKKAEPEKKAEPAKKEEGPKLDAPKSEPAKEAPKAEPKKEEPKPEVKKEEPKKAEAPKSEPAKEAPKAEPKKEEPKAEMKKEEPKKAEAPKSEPAKEAPKAEPKKDEPKKAAAAPAAAAAVAAVAAKTSASAGKPAAGPLDWNQWGGSPHRNNTPQGKNIPAEFDPGDFDDDGNWKTGTGENIQWVAAVGSQTYGNPVVANGKIYVGTNNGHGYMTRYPATVDLGCLICFNEKDGKFLWQHSSEKLPTGRVHDWPLQGICCSPYIEGDRLWFVTSRGEVMCLDAEGFADNENDGPFTGEKLDNEKDKPHEADVIWVFDMMKDLGVSQHNMCSCSVTATGDTLWVCTSNGVDESHINLPAPNAPSFLAIDKNTGKVIWKDGSPGNNILHGQWSSPAVSTLGGVPQVMFAGGDSWLYSFKAERTPEKPELLWEFDANPKATEYILGGRGTRNEIICTPVIYDNKVYIAVGQDPEHGEGVGHLWCIDPTKRGDVSAELAVELADRTKKVPKRRLKAIENPMAETPVSNPNSAVVWHYSEYDQNGDKKIDFEETMHRTIGTPTIKDDILYIPDFSGLVHCVDAKTGKPYWTHDLFAATWGSALVVDGKVYVGDEEGKLTVFKHGKEKEIIAEIDMKNSIYSSPIVANNTLYLVNKTHLFAVKAKD